MNQIDFSEVSTFSQAFGFDSNIELLVYPNQDEKAGIPMRTEKPSIFDAYTCPVSVKNTGLGRKSMFTRLHSYVHDFRRLCEPVIII